MNKKRNFKLNSKGLLIIMTIICVGLILATFSSDRISTPFRSIAGYVITPFQNGINDIGAWMTSKAAGFQDVAALSEENAQLQKKVDELTSQNNELIQSQSELERLQELYKLGQKYSEYDTVAAEVISKDPGNWYSTFVINKGKADGLSVDMNVIGQGGLIGIVTEVGNNWAQVRSIIDDESNVSAMLADTSQTCTVTGSLLEMDQGKIDFIQLSDTDNHVKEGDAVVTSNISSKFLTGILIGYVSDVVQDTNNLTKSGTIVPVANFKNLREVLVITELKQTKENS
ncbi:MAG: rod shape-determining protein MreC [Lachnospiraceae bacterium]|jgi:rod shape-determining protein MreC|nr:rod shape-determining protein MreC [Lachnospiraceae bacterium]MCI1726687.1 rod shape-determining protein MreC [Lachnospiraceae bacterium]